MWTLCRAMAAGSLSPSGTASVAFCSAAGGNVELKAKSGKSLIRFFPEVRAKICVPSCPKTKLVLDGELLIPVGGNFSFDALQMRLHPSDQSSVQGYRQEQPATFMLHLTA